MKATMSDLEQKLMKLGEAIYAQQQAQQAQGQPNAGQQAGGEQKAQPEDVEFEEVK